ncbi:MAG: hypothetical protein ACPKQO_09105 [Nitrososphaeraceae archaeon]
MKINLQLLIIFWWIGAGIALISFLLPIYIHYIIIAGIGWIIILSSTILIVYEIKKIKEEDNNDKI